MSDKYEPPFSVADHTKLVEAILARPLHVIKYLDNAAEGESTEPASTGRWVSSQAARHRRAALVLERRYG